MDYFVLEICGEAGVETGQHLQNVGDSLKVGGVHLLIALEN